MKTVLFITPFAPSDIGAAMKFTKRTIETLAESFIVDLIYFRAEGEPYYEPKNKNIRLKEVLSVNRKDRLLSVSQKLWLYPIFSVRYRKALVKKLRRLSTEESYSLVFLDHSQSFIYGKYFPSLPKILMSHDVIYQRVSRTSGKMISIWCKLTEKYFLNQPNSYIYSFSTKDQALIKDSYGFDSYVTSGNIDELAIAVSPFKIADDFVFLGQWVRKDNYEGLVWFLDNVFPLVEGKYTFKIIGRGLPESVHNKIRNCKNIEYLGFVDNPYQMITEARAVISPFTSIRKAWKTRARSFFSRS